MVKKGIGVAPWGIVQHRPRFGPQPVRMQNGAEGDASEQYSLIDIPLSLLYHTVSSEMCQKSDKK